MNSISFAAQDAVMNGDVETAMKLEKDYNRKEQEVLLYEWDFITDNLDSYMSALLLEVFMVENKVNKEKRGHVYLNVVKSVRELAFEQIDSFRRITVGICK